MRNNLIKEFFSMAYIAIIFFVYMLLFYYILMAVLTLIFEWVVF